MHKIKGSFRDPSGFLFQEKGILYRNINNSYKKDYNKALFSGLLKALWNEKLLIKHSEEEKERNHNIYKIIKPEFIPFISYPYEWCFSQLKDAALLTLQIQKKALSYEMTLKDASAFNIQFKKGNPILIDTLSFEEYEEGTPWVAYKQFCQHFLAPLALMCYHDLRLNQMSRTSIDGIPLEIASSLLPRKTLLNFSLFTHIHLHAKTQSFYSDKQTSSVSRRKLSKSSLIAFIENLEKAILSLKLREIKTEWCNYYSDTNYSNDSFSQKKKLVENFLVRTNNIKTVWDLGGNTGLFSRIASNKNIATISFDIDPIAIEKSYILTKKQKETNILPLVLDLTNPSPSLGWAHSERDSLEKRSNADLIMALALIHHLAISNNLPFENIAEYFSKLGKYLIIEFIPKSDSNTKKLFATRKDVFPKYNKQDFKKSFSKFYNIIKEENIKNSERILYLMKKI